MVGYSSQYLDAPGDLNRSLFFAWVLVLARMNLGLPGLTWMVLAWVKHDRLILQVNAYSDAGSVINGDGCTWDCVGWISTATYTSTL